MNPLKQYFRRPALYIKLPSEGKIYQPGVVEMTENGELPVYPMTAIDEITSKTPDALFSGQAVVDIIQSCVPNIKNAWAISSIDMNMILVAIKIASVGETMAINTKCPACSEESKYEINLINVLNEQVKNSGQFNDSIKVGDLVVKFKPLSLADTNKTNMAQYELQKMLYMLDQVEESPERRQQVQQTINQLNNLMTEVLAATIDSVRSPQFVVTNKDHIKEYLENVDRNSFNTIRDYSITIKEKHELKPLHFKCMHCSHEYDQPFVLNITDFFV